MLFRAFNRRWRFLIVAICVAVFSPTLSAIAAETKSIAFNEPVSSHEWTLKEVNPDLPSDWTGFDFLVLEFRASSSQRFELGLKTVNNGADQLISKRIHPYPGVWVRASIPLRFYRQGLGNASDLAATVNQPRNSYWINIESGGFGPTTDVRGMSVVMRYPTGAPKLEIRSVTLAKDDPGDAVLEGNPLIDEFGQYAPLDWPGKAKSLDQLKKDWEAEKSALGNQALPDRCKFGGFASTHAKATGFFHVEQIDGRWWFVCPEGHLFYSTGVNGIGTGSGSRVEAREEMFTPLPEALKSASTTAPIGQRARGGPQLSYYTANLQRRFGADWRLPWAELTGHRLDAWGLNTSYGTGLSDALGDSPLNKPYVMVIRGFQFGTLVMGMPDVYSEAFVQQVQTETARQLSPRKNDPYLLGYFIGNEPPWPGRESQFVDLVLQGPATEMQKRFKADLSNGDTPERRRDMVLAAFERYLKVINTTVKQQDPNHLNLGIRFGGTPPDYVVKLAKDFDVYSLNKYRWEPPPELLKKVYELTGRPMLLGEFHMGVPARGMAPGLVQVMNQEERGVAYQYYVEHAASHPEVIGTHWFQWIDQPALGRPDGENYNIGWIDVTDRPYQQLVEAAKQTHGRLLDIHSGKIQPTTRKAKTSEIGTPGEANQLGRPAIQ